MTKQELDDLTYEVIGCAIDVHKELGPGLLESIYEKCFIIELLSEGYKVNSQSNVPIIYKENEIDCELRYDVMVDNILLVELKAVEKILPIHEAQLLTYMKLLKKPKGVILNFNVINLAKFGCKTFVNQLYADLV